MNTPSTPDNLKWDEITEENFYFFFFFGMGEGLTLRECIHGKGSQKPAQVQPNWFKGTYQEYSKAMKTYIQEML